LVKFLMQELGDWRLRKEKIINQDLRMKGG
jgi:hypothetical protein